MSGDGTEDPRMLALRELRAKRAQVVAEREARAEAPPDIAEQIAQEERALRDEQGLSAAIDEHGAVGRVLEPVQTDLGLVVIKRCTAMRWRKFQDADDYRNEAFLALVMPCVVYPTRPEVEAMLEEQPAILARLSNAVARLAGVRVQELAKK